MNNFKDWKAVPENTVPHREIVSDLSVANGFIKKCLLDVPRAGGWNVWPSDDQTNKCCDRLSMMAKDLSRILELIESSTVTI